MTTWSADARGPVDVFLDRVERGLLSAGVVRPARATVIQALEADIAEKVSRLGKGEKVDARDVCATLETLGAGSVGGSAPAVGREWQAYVKGLMPRRSRAGFWGTVCVMVSLLPMAAVLLILTFFLPAGFKVEAHFPRDGVQAQLGTEAETVFRATGPEGTIDATLSGRPAGRQFFSLFAPLSPLALAATLLGLCGVVEILSSRGKVTGLSSALFAMLFYPVLLGMIAWWLTLG